MSTSYQIDFIVGDCRIGDISWQRRSSPLTLETLSQLLVDRDSQFRGCALSYADNEILIESDSQLCEAIHRQTRDGTHTLCFYVNTASLPSSCSSCSSCSSEGKDKDTPTEASLEANIVLLSLVRRYCAEAKKEHLSPLYLACQADDTEAVRALLTCTYDVVENESEDVKKYVKTPVEERINTADDTEDCFTPLHIAAEVGKTDIVSLLLSHKADIETKTELERTALLIAANDGNTETVSLLLANKANMETKDAYGHTPLHECSEYGHAETVSLLLTNGANIEAKDNLQYTPLFLACRGGHTETVSLLLTHRANIEPVNNKLLYTPLHIAAKNGHTATASLLLAHKANIEAKDQGQSTPLHLAFSNGRTETASLLLAQKANVEAKDNKGQTSLDTAKNKKPRLL